MRFVFWPKICQMALVSKGWLCSLQWSFLWPRVKYFRFFLSWPRIDYTFRFGKRL